MAVTFTSNIGLAKPTESEIAKKWTNIDQLQSFNNGIITSKTNIGLSSYTPVMVGQTSAPTLGSGGVVRGEYQDIQGIIQGSYVIEFGTTPGVGSGEFGISLPLVVDPVYHSVGSALNSNIGSFSCIGEGYIFDSSNVSLSGTVALDVVTISGVSYIRMITETFAAPTKTNRLFAASMPFVISTGDKWSGSFIYKKQ